MTGALFLSLTVLYFAVVFTIDSLTSERQSGSSDR